MYVKLGMVGGKIRCQVLTSLNVDMFIPGTAVGSPSFYPMHQVLVNVGYTVLEGEPALYLYELEETKFYTLHETTLQGAL